MFLSYWLRQLNRKVLELERKGYDLTWAKQILQGSGITQDLRQLISLSGELETLKLLSRIFSPDEIRRGDRVDFIIGRTGIEVWTPVAIKPQRNVLMLIENIANELRWSGKKFHQIVYSPRSTNPTVFYSDAKLPEGIVQQGAEILLDILNFQDELAQDLMKETRRRRGKFLKSGIRGSVAINISHLTVANPAILAEKLQQQFKPSDSKVLDGILLITHNPYLQKPSRELIVVPNPYSVNPISEEDFSEVIIKELIFAPYAYAMPILLHYKRKGLMDIFKRGKDGILSFNRNEVARSLVADTTVAITGLGGKISRIKFIEFESARKRFRIPL